MENSKYKVCVRCFTYNHAPYIEDAMNGFCKQNTDFPYVCVIVDDASTDGEPEIVRNYFNNHFDLSNKAIARKEETDDYVLLFAQHSDNPNCYFAVYLLKYNHYDIKKTKFPYFSVFHDNAKYVALCEGDDYWLDPFKLEKQYKYMDANPNCALNYTMAYEQKGHVLGKRLGRPNSGFESLLLYNPIPTVSVCIRVERFLGIQKKYYDPKWKMGDYPMWLYLSLDNEIHFIPEITCVYRVVSESATHSKNVRKVLAFIDSTYDIRAFFIEKYAVEKKGKLLKQAETIRFYNKQACFLTRGMYVNTIIFLLRSLFKIDYKYLYSLVSKKNR